MTSINVIESWGTHNGKRLIICYGMYTFKKAVIYFQALGNFLSSAANGYIYIYIHASSSDTSEMKLTWISIICYIARNKQFNLIYFGRDKNAAIFQKTFSNAFSWTKMYKFWLRLHWSLFPRVQLTHSSIGLGNGLVPFRHQAIIWSNDCQFSDTYMRNSASIS